MNKILNAEAFDEVMETAEELKGLHSIRKIAATRAKKNGCSKDEIDHRFRWKQKKQQDKYVSTDVPYADAKVCGALCKGGPIHCHLKEESGISSNWICDHVVPNIKQVYGPVVAKVLGHALMWRIFDAIKSLVCDIEMVVRVKGLYSRIEGMLSNGCRVCVYRVRVCRVRVCRVRVYRVRVNITAHSFFLLYNNTHIHRQQLAGRRESYL